MALLTVAVLWLTGCTEEIDFDLNESEEQLLVVEGRITTEKMAHQVKLSLSSEFYGTTDNPPATGAEVSISDGVNQFILNEFEPGIYLTDADVAGEIGKTYNLLINYGGESYESVATIDSVPPIDSLLVKPTDFTVGPFKDYYELLIFTKEKDGLGDYYMWRSFVNGESRSDTLGDFQFQDDALFDGQQWNGVLVDFVKAEPGDTVTLKQYTISEEAYDIYLAANLEVNWRGGIFDAPPANVPSNISNGALGLFDASDVAQKTAVIKD